MCNRLILSLAILAALSGPIHAQTLPDDAGPSNGSNSSTPSQEDITNPGGFGGAADETETDPSRTDATTKPDCKQQQDIKTGRRAVPEKNKDCVR